MTSPAVSKNVTAQLCHNDTHADAQATWAYTFRYVTGAPELPRADQT